MKRSRKITIGVCTAVAAFCLAVPFAMQYSEAKAEGAQAGLQMVNGASVRLGEKQGIRFIASVSDPEKEYSMMIVPAAYVDKYCVPADGESEYTGDYYAAIVEGLTADGKEAYVATMDCAATLAGENDLGLDPNGYYIKGSLTTIQYKNTNVKWFGIAYYTENDVRYYATFNEGQNERSVVKVASGCLNKYSYGESDTQTLKEYVAKGLALANGTAEEDYVYSEPTFTADNEQISVTYGAEPRTFTVGGLNAEVDIAVEWQSSHDHDVTVDENGTASFVGVTHSCLNGCKPGSISASCTAEDQPVTVTAKVCGSELTVATVTTFTKRVGSTMETNTCVVAGVTFSGEENPVDTPRQLEVKGYDIQADGLKFFMNAAAGIDMTQCSITEGGVLRAVKPNKSGAVVCPAWKIVDEDGDVKEWDRVNVYVSWAITSKKDMDKLALAYARGTHANDWGEGARYTLMNDIDYAGGVFIPIAAHVGRGTGTASYIGLQWKTLLSENDYGITYDEFKVRGLNHFAWTVNANAKAAESRFNGVFDGNGYTISNAKMMFDATGFKVSDTMIGFNTGIFGSIGEKGVLKNTSFVNFSRQGYAEAGYATYDTDNATQFQFDSVDLATTGAVSATASVARAVGPERTSGLALIGNIYGTVEDVYVQASYDDFITTKPSTVATGMQSFIAFNTWGTSSLKNCCFDVTGTVMRSGNMYAFRIEEANKTTIDNVIIYGLKQNDGTSGVSLAQHGNIAYLGESVQLFETADALKAACQAGTVEIGTNWKIDEATGLPVLKIR